ncbi:hypothetical protein ACHAQA_000308 [Verticillium albo-atrum]
MAAPMLKQLAAVAIAFQSLTGLAAAAALPLLDARDGAEPGLPHASDTTSYCSWWADYDGSQTCSEVLEWNWIDLKTFRRWNPSVGSDCSGIKTGNSYCVEAFNEPTPPPEDEDEGSTPETTTITSSQAVATTPPTITSTTSITTTSTTAGNGVETPQPIQGGLVKNCAKFHFVETGDSCDAIAKKYGITISQFTSFNGLNSGCTNLWGETYACVALVGGSPAQTTPTTATTTKPSNGVSTPAPVHAGIVNNCNKFYFVQSGDSCASIAQKNGIRTADVVAWNGLNSGCTNLWLDTFACVALVGGSPAQTTPATTTKPSNGVSTPAPVHTGIVNNCNKFYFVQSGDSCASIAQKNSVRTADIVAWNGLNSGCTNLWLDTFACAGVIGGTTTPATPTTTTKAGNGIQTPQPTQPGISSSCNKFYKVVSGDSCASIAKKNGVSAAQFTQWNSLNSGCTNLWGDVYACVGIVGSTPTPTSPSNGIQTPQPTQGKLVANCKKFELVAEGDTCAAVAKRRGISIKQLTDWNPSIGSDCKSLWAKAYACVGI